MAHFAELDATGTVIRVIVVHNNDAPDEATGIAFCKTLYGTDTLWAQTSYNGNMRKQYAGIGCKLDAAKDVFVAPQPFPSWTLTKDQEWTAPTEQTDAKNTKWDETSKQWVKP